MEEIKSLEKPWKTSKHILCSDWARVSSEILCMAVSKILYYYYYYYYYYCLLLQALSSWYFSWISC